MKKTFIFPFFLIIFFFIFTICVKKIDVQPTGLQDSLIGFAEINTTIHKVLGINLLWYTVTDWLGIVSIIFAFGFMVLGLYQMIQRRSITRVDKKLLLMGLFYILTYGLYVFFEKNVINYRPLFLENKLEASYPSSHIMIVVTILGTGNVFLKDYITSSKTYISFIVNALILITIAGRLISGVHWITDIIGGVLISSGLVSLYRAIHKIL